VRKISATLFKSRYHRGPIPLYEQQQRERSRKGQTLVRKNECTSAVPRIFTIEARNYPSCYAAFIVWNFLVGELALELSLVFSWDDSNLTATWDLFDEYTVNQPTPRWRSRYMIGWHCFLARWKVGVSMSVSSIG